MADFGPKPASDSAQSPKFDDFHGVFPGKERGKERVRKKERKTDGVREANCVEAQTQTCKRFGVAIFVEATLEGC